MYQNLPDLIYPFRHLTPIPWQYFFPIRFNVEIWTSRRRYFHTFAHLILAYRFITRTSRLTRSSVSIYILFVIPHNIPCVQTFYVLNLLYMWSIDIVKVGPPSLPPPPPPPPSRYRYVQDIASLNCICISLIRWIGPSTPRWSQLKLTGLPVGTSLFFFSSPPFPPPFSLSFSGMHTRAHRYRCVTATGLKRLGFVDAHVAYHFDVSKFARYSS